MIGFEHSLWLWALAALSVPVLIHLLGRRAAPPRDFPPAVLLERDGARTARHRRIKELLKLFLRLGLVAVIVLTFARPQLPETAGDGVPVSAPTGLLLVIDDSPSMTRPADPAAPKGKTRLALAVEKARASLARLGAGSEAAVIFASGRSLGPDEPRKLAAVLQEPAASPDASLERALQAVPQFIEAMAPLPAGVLLISDCEAGALQAASVAKLRERARVSTLDLGTAGSGDDWGLSAARLDRRRLVAGEDAEILVGVIRSAGKGEIAARQLQLILGGKAIAWRSVAMAPGAEAEVALRFSVPAGTHVGELRLAGDDPWDLNDHLPAAVSAQPAARVAIICERNRIAGSGRALRLALSAGPGAERKAFLAETLAPRSAELSELSSYSAFVLVGPPRLSEETRTRLSRRVAAGSGAVVLCEDPAALRELAVKLGLPVPPSEEKLVRVESRARLVPDTAGEDLFATFRPAAAADVFKRLVELKPGRGRVLARGRAPGLDLPALVEHGLGRGPVLVFCSSPQRRYSLLSEREHANLFVPLMHELVSRAAGLTGAGRVARPGGSLRIAASPRERAATFWRYDSSGLRTPLGPLDRDLHLHLAAPPAPGAYRLISESDGRLLAERALAVRLAPEELAGRRPEGEPAEAAAMELDAALAAAVRPARRGRDLSGALAVVGLVLLVCEALVGFLAARRAPVHQDAPARQKRGRAAA